MLYMFRPLQHRSQALINNEESCTESFDRQTMGVHGYPTPMLILFIIILRYNMKYGEFKTRRVRNLDVDEPFLMNFLFNLLIILMVD